MIRPWLMALLAQTAVSAASPEFLATLYKIDAGLMATQVNASGDSKFGALVCPSTNPDKDKLHSRAGEAVYPLAVAFKRSQDAKYADAAIKLGNWLIKVQDGGGNWSEDWPDAGWNGTTADQLISLAGAYPMLKARLTAQENTAWVNSIKKAADYVEANFPMGNINYQPTGAVSLKMAFDAVGGPTSWTSKAASLMTETLKAINADKFLTGEGKGIDLGYNIAQSIGYIALYGILLKNASATDAAVQMLQTHYRFMYPNGAMDNSWGTRSYKWMLESGSKTAPGVPFTFALLADKDPKFNRAAQLAVKFLSEQFLDGSGRVVYGPHASRHPSSSPPCLYPSFARAQSLALAVEYGPDVSASAPIPAETKNWSLYYPTAKTGMVRTDKIMATVTAYDGIDQYPRGTVARGGSLTLLWFEGYGETGFLQASGQTVYSREEPRHMPAEGDLLPLTPRIERTDGNSNLYDDNAALAVAAETGGFKTTSTGVLRNAGGTSAGVNFTWVRHFAADSYTQEVTVSSPQNIRIVEPFVNNAGNQYALAGDSAFRITTAQGGVWELRVLSSTTPFTLAAGESKEKYWMPFPGLEAYPLTLKLNGSSGSQTVKYIISQTKTVGLKKSEPGRAAVRLLPGAGLSWQYALPRPARIRLSLRNPQGRELAEIFHGYAGRSGTLHFPGALPRGIYLVLLEVEGKPAAGQVFPRY